MLQIKASKNYKQNRDVINLRHMLMVGVKYPTAHFRHHNSGTAIDHAMRFRDFS